MNPNDILDQFRHGRDTVPAVAAALNARPNTIRSAFARLVREGVLLVRGEEKGHHGSPLKRYAPTGVSPKPRPNRRPPRPREEVPARIWDADLVSMIVGRWAR